MRGTTEPLMDQAGVSSQGECPLPLGRCEPEPGLPEQMCACGQNTEALGLDTWGLLLAHMGSRAPGEVAAAEWGLPGPSSRFVILHTVSCIDDTVPGGLEEEGCGGFLGPCF